jgi:hypothetical protein
LREAGAAVGSVTLIGGLPPGSGTDQPLVAPGSAIAQHTLRAIAAYDPPLYAGDVVLVWLSGDPSGTPVSREDAVASWERLCLGEVTVVDLPVAAGDRLARRESVIIGKLPIRIYAAEHVQARLLSILKHVVEE